MRVIKLSIISGVVLFLLATSISLLFPSVVVVSRAIDIKSYKKTVYPLVSDIRNWQQWIEGMNGSTVKVYSAGSAKLGNTNVEIISLTDTTIVSIWKSEQSAQQESTIRLITDSLQKTMVVQWQFVQKLNWYPWEKFGSMMNDKIIGTMIEKNLLSLKQIAEK